jgi:hypothetical protein
MAGREALAEFPGVGAQMVDRLTEAGLYTPARIVRAGLEALEAVPGIGQAKAAAIFKAAVEWIEAHPAVVDPEPTPDGGLEDVGGPVETGSEDVPRAQTG